MADVPTIALVIVVLYLLSSIKILREYERGVIFRLGRMLPKPKGPGIILVFAPIDRMVRVSLRIETMEVPPQDLVTKDNVSSTSCSASERNSTFGFSRSWTSTPALGA